MKKILLPIFVFLIVPFGFSQSLDLTLANPQTNLLVFGRVHLPVVTLMAIFLFLLKN